MLLPWLLAKMMFSLFCDNSSYWMCFLPACYPEIRGNPHLLIKYHSGFFVDGKFLCCQQSCKAAPGCTLWEACNVTPLLGEPWGGWCPIRQIRPMPEQLASSGKQDVPDWLASWNFSLKDAIWQMKSNSRVNWVMLIKIIIILTSAILSLRDEYFLHLNHKSSKELFIPAPRNSSWFKTDSQ